MCQSNHLLSLYTLVILTSLNAMMLMAERATYTETSNCTCGRILLPRERIVGGRVSGLHEFPMMAALIDGVRARLHCGATVVSEEYVITAAHCLPSSRPHTVAVLVGDHDLSTNKDTQLAQLIPVDYFVLHPGYSEKAHVNDIAIVKLRWKLQFGRAVWPACLPFHHKNSDFAGEKVTVLGWGTVSFLGPTSNKLLKVKLGVLSHDECLKKHTDVTPQHMCSFAPEKDACQTDSGGPLLWSGRNKRNTLVGIVSYGTGCATHMPGVNTRVTEYLDWIMDNTPGAEYCNRITKSPKKREEN